MIYLLIETIHIICPKYRLHWYIDKWYTALMSHNMSVICDLRTRADTVGIIRLFLKAEWDGGWCCLANMASFTSVMPVSLFSKENLYAPISQANWCNMTFTSGNLFPSHSCIGDPSLDHTGIWTWVPSMRGRLLTNWAIHPIDCMLIVTDHTHFEFDLNQA